jgi:hypothetical protein
MDSALAPLQAQLDAVVNINAPDLLSYAGWMANQAALKQRMEGMQGTWLLVATPRACECSYFVRQRGGVVVQPLQLTAAKLMHSIARTQCLLVTLNAEQEGVLSLAAHYSLPYCCLLLAAACACLQPWRKTRLRAAQQAANVKQKSHMTSTRRWWSASKTQHLAAATHWHWAHTQFLAGHPQQQLQQQVLARQQERTAAWQQRKQPVQHLLGYPRTRQQQGSSRRYDVVPCLLLLCAGLQHCAVCACLDLHILTVRLSQQCMQLHVLPTTAGHLVRTLGFAVSTVGKLCSLRCVVLCCSQVTKELPPWLKSKVNAADAAVGGMVSAEQPSGAGPGLGFKAEGDGLGLKADPGMKMEGIKVDPGLKLDLEFKQVSGQSG